MVKECVRFPSKVTSDNASTKLMKASALYIVLNDGLTETLIELTV